MLGNLPFLPSPLFSRGDYYYYNPKNNSFALNFCNVFPQPFAFRKTPSTQTTRAKSISDSKSKSNSVGGAIQNQSFSLLSAGHFCISADAAAAYRECFSRFNPLLCRRRRRIFFRQLFPHPEKCLQSVFSCPVKTICRLSFFSLPFTVQLKPRDQSLFKSSFFPQETGLSAVRAFYSFCARSPPSPAPPRLPLKRV